MEVAQKVEHIGMVVDQITLDIESAQVWQCLQLLTVLCLGDEVVRDVESLDLSQALETLHYLELVVRQVDRVGFGQGREVFNLGYRVLVDVPRNWCEWASKLTIS